jgi:hypothetical protein
MFDYRQSVWYNKDDNSIIYSWGKIMGSDVDTLAMIESETSQAYKAFVDYARMGPLRSFSKLITVYKTRSEDAPSTSLTTIKAWSANHNWIERCKIYDHETELELESSVRQRRLNLLDKFGALIEQAIEGVELDNVSLSQISGALKTYLDSSMGILNDMPVQHMEILTTGNAEDVKETETDALRQRALELLGRLSLVDEMPFLSSQDETMYQSPQIETA